MSGDTLTAALLLGQAEDWLAASAFRAGRPERAGVEIEFFVTDRSDPGRRVPAATLAALASSAPLSAGGTVTAEPGGQVELSTLPHLSLPDILAAAQTDLAELRQRAHAHGLLLVGQGSDPVHAPRRVTEHPRYAAMETYLDRWGPAARQMMCSTAAVQITVEAGQYADRRPAAMGPASRRGSGARRGVRLLPPARRSSDGVEEHASAHLGVTRPGTHPTGTPGAPRQVPGKP